MIEVLLVDDEAMVREGFRMILETAPDIYVAGEAEDAPTRSGRLRRSGRTSFSWTFACRTSRLEATRRRVAAGSARVHVVTTFDNDEYVYEAL